MIEVQSHGSMLRIIRPQLILLGVVCGLAVASEYNVLPPTSDLLNTLRTLFVRYGLIAVAVCSFLENIIGLNIYFPGSVVILTGMALTAGHPSLALKTWTVIFCFAIMAHYVNFLGGRLLAVRGRYLPSSRLNSIIGKKTRLLTLFLATFWHPHFAAVTSYACGVNGVGYAPFSGYLALATGLWYAFWGFLFYNVGKAIPEKINLSPVFLAYIMIWIIWDVVRYRRSHVRQNASQ